MTEHVILEEKMKTILISMISIVVLAGCATVKPDTTNELNQVGQSVSTYGECLEREGSFLLRSSETPIDIAESVSYKCEIFLNEYRKSVVSFFTALTPAGSQSQYDLLMIEPDRRVMNLRDKGKRATISRVLDYRLSLSK